MPIVVEEPLSTATTVPLSSDSRQEPESTMSTQVGEQKVRPDVSSFIQTTVSGGCMPKSHFPNGQDKMVQFKGLYVVRGPTEPKHVRYTMDITVDELQLRGRCIQRFHSFFMLRKRLLEVFKTCRGRLPTRRSMLTGVNNEPEPSASADLVELLTRPRCPQCPECESTYDQLAAVKFPRRTLFPPSLQDIQERSQVLETFLDYCVRIATTWPACERSKRLFTTILGTFLGVDLKAYLAAESANRAVVSVNIVEDDKQKQPSLEEETKADGKITDLPSFNEMDETSQSSGYRDKRHSEPNFSFIPKTEDAENDAVKIRSKSHH